MISKIILFGTVLGMASTYHMHHLLSPSTAKNTVMDAKTQPSLIRCWEDSEEGTRLSEPVYSLCSYMPDPFDVTKVYVNGVEDGSDDYTKVLALFQTGVGHAMLQVCLQEAFQFHRADQPSQVALRCLCKREGCNAPKIMPENFEFNKVPLPRHQ